MTILKLISKYPYFHPGHFILIVISIWGGCSIYSTFPQEETNSWIKMLPSDPPVPQIIAATLVQAAADTGMSKIAFSLTEKMGSETYLKVKSRLAQKKSFIRPIETSDTTGVFLTQVRVRGFRAEVDVILPNRENAPYFKTYFLERQPIGRFKVVNHRDWELPVEWPAKNIPQTSSFEN